MSANLKAIAARYASALKASEVFTSDPEDRPTATDIWLYKLEDVVIRNVEYPHSPSSDEYDHSALYNHRHCLKTKEDVQCAPDNVLLESLKLGTVENWGWLRFIVREMGMTSLLINNWGWQQLKGSEALFGDDDTEEERRAQAVRYFLDLMSERGLDPLGDVRKLAQTIKDQIKEKSGKEWSESEFVAWLKGYDEWLYFVYALNSTVIRPEALSKDKVLYTDPQRTQLYSKIKTAAERRRRNWNAEWSCDCQKGNPITDK